MACGILAPRPGIEPMPPAVEAWSLNHWTNREAPRGMIIDPFHKAGPCQARLQLTKSQSHWIMESYLLPDENQLSISMTSFG